MRLLLLLTLLCACTAPRSGGGDDDDSATDDDDAALEPSVDESQILASIVHSDSSPCPDPMGWITLINPLADDIDFNLGQGPSVNGLSILAFDDHALDEGEDGRPFSAGTLPGESTYDVYVAFNCSDLVSSEAAIVGSLNLVGYELELFVEIAP